MAIKNQVLGTTIVSYVCLMMGVLFTRPSSVVNLYSSKNTTLNRIMTESEISLLGSMSSISSVVVLPFCGLLLDRLGRKYTCVVFSLLQVVSCSIVSVSTNVEAILIASFISGVTSCTLLAVPMYVGEFCQESIRGCMGSGVLVLFGIGTLVSYLLGGLVEYQIMNYICLSMSVFGFVVLSLFMKESPLILVKKGLDNEAARNIAYFRSAKLDSKEVQQEMDNIRRALFAQLDEATPEEEKLKPQIEQKEKLSTWHFIKKSRSTRRALLVCFILTSAAVFQGLVVIQVYAGPLFLTSLPTVSTTLCTVIFAIVTIISGIIAAYLVETLGRKSLMVYTSLGAAVCCVLLGTQIQLSWGPYWSSAVYIYLFCLFYTIGAGTVPYIYIAEVFLPEIKGFASMLVMEWMFLGFFILLYVFTPVVNVIGLGPVFYIFAVFSLITAVLCAIWMPETKGLPVDVIQEKFAKPRNPPNII